MKTRRIVDRYVLTEEPLLCGHCGAKTPMYIVCTGDNVEVYDGSRDKGLFAEHTWQVLLCPSCHLENVFQFVQFADDACLLGVIDDEEIWETPVTTHMLYPHRNLDLPDPHPDMPSHIKEDYEEAQNVFEFSSRSATALLRLVIQKLCVELGEKGKNLNRDIANLVRGGLPQHIQQALDVVRVIGNESVHPGTIDVRDDPEIAKELFLLVNEIVDDRFGRPKREALIETRYKSLPKSKLDGIEVRDAK